MPLTPVPLNKSSRLQSFRLDDFIHEVKQLARSDKLRKKEHRERKCSFKLSLKHGIVSVQENQFVCYVRLGELKLPHRRGAQQT